MRGGAYYFVRDSEPTKGTKTSPIIRCKQGDGLVLGVMAAETEPYLRKCAGKSEKTQRHRDGRRTERQSQRWMRGAVRWIDLTHL